MRKLTEKQRAVLLTLEQAEDEEFPALSPTQIGQRNGKKYHEASSWASGALKSLLERDAVKAVMAGQYRLTPWGRQAIKDGEA